MIQRSYIVLISGGVLFVIGIAISIVWAGQFASVFLQDNTLVSKVLVQPGKSVESTKQVTDASRPLSVAIHIQGANGASDQLRSDIVMVETVTNESGAVVNTNEFSSNFFTTFEPKMPGNYVLTITNTGTEPVTIDGTFGHMPFMTANNGAQPDFGKLSGIIAGGALASIGFLTIIAGIVILIIDGRKHSTTAPVTGEGGVTYRKD